MEKIEFRAMGSGMMAALEADGPEARTALAEIPLLFEKWESHLSRFRAESELNTINRQRGLWISVSPVMWEMLLAARSVERMSGGLVTPALQGALEAFGYDRSFELVATIDADLSLEAIHPQRLGRLNIELDSSQRRVRLPAGMTLDFGGIAKGWAADMALERLEPLGPALVDAGGDVAASPRTGTGSAWPVGITDPHAPEEVIDVLALQGRAVATSGRDVRSWLQAGRRRHHIIDPRTGTPAENRVLTSTAIAPNALEAEMAAKCSFILGEVEGKAWLDARPEYAGLLILEDGTRIFSQTMENYIWST